MVLKLTAYFVDFNDNREILFHRGFYFGFLILVEVLSFRIFYPAARVWRFSFAKAGVQNKLLHDRG